MLTRFTKEVAARIGAFLAAFALASFVAPPIAVAFVPNPSAVHCLVHADDQTDYSAPGGVSHRGDADHDRHSGNGPDHKSICCGMFSVTALVPDSTMGMIPYWTIRSRCSSRQISTLSRRSNPTGLLSPVPRSCGRLSCSPYHRGQARGIASGCGRIRPSRRLSARPQ